MLNEAEKLATERRLAAIEWACGSVAHIAPGRNLATRSSPTAVARLSLRVDQGSKSLREPRNVRPTEGSEQLVDRVAPTPYVGLALDNPGEYLRLLLALIDKEPIEVGNLNAVTSQWLFEVAAVECKEQLGIARNRQGADVNVLRVLRQGFNVEVISDLDGVDSAAREFPPHMANPYFGRLI